MSYTDECEEFLRRKIDHAVAHSDDHWLEVRGGDLEQDLGWTRRMTIVCAAMYKVKLASDDVRFQPPKGKGNNLRIAYNLAERRAGRMQVGASVLPVNRQRRAEPSPVDEGSAAIPQNDSFLGVDEPFAGEHERERIEVSVTLRRGQPQFRRDLLRAYDGRCAITGCDVVAVLEAAHICPVSENGSDHVDNGLLLRADVHTLMDTGLLILTYSGTDCVVSLHADLQSSAYSALHGAPLRTPTHPALIPRPEYVRRRWGT